MGQAGQQRDNGEKFCPTSYTQAGQKIRGKMDAGQERTTRDDTHTFPAPAPADGLDARVDEKADGFTFPLNGEPLPCTACTCWQSVPGLAWWCGRRAATGRRITTRSTCDRGFLDWQAAPVELRTAPQRGGAEAEAVEATACAY